MPIHSNATPTLVCSDLAGAAFSGQVAPIGDARAWRAEVPAIRDPGSRVWRHVPDLFQPEGRAIISSAKVSGHAEKNYPFPVMRSAATLLAETGVPLASYRVMDLDSKIQIPVILRSPIFRPGQSSDRDPEDLVVGFVVGDRAFRAKEYRACLDALVTERARLLRETINAERQRSRSSEATRRAEGFSHEVHALTLLVGVLQGISPPETNHQIACAAYGTWQRYGLGEVAVRVDDGADLELVLPPLALSFCDPMYPGQERDNDSRGRGKMVLESLQQYMKAEVSDDVRVRAEEYTIAHRYEGLEYQTIVVRCAKALELKVAGALRWHFNIDPGFKELLRSRVKPPG